MLVLKYAQWLIDILNDVYKQKFTGNIQINFFEGGITNLTKTQSFKPKQ